jgi:pimeloyl-ACP methyl ester carboxylesterase
MSKRIVLALALVMLTQDALAATCATDDFERHVSGVSQCLLMRRFGASEPDSMVVWIHGDASAGGPANTHFAIAEAATSPLEASKVLSVALVRPGYPDGSGESSSVSLLHGGRVDHYTKENLGEVAGAIERLRARFKPKRVVVVGHSGGAATTAALLGMRPGLFEAAVLVSCPCDLVAWRVGRRPYSASEDPIRWADRVSTSARVIALTGAADRNTSPALARSFVDALVSRGIDARLTILPDRDHASAFAAPEVVDSVRQLLAGR